jgi:hypothetical protein
VGLVDGKWRVRGRLVEVVLEGAPADTRHPSLWGASCDTPPSPATGQPNSNCEDVLSFRRLQSLISVFWQDCGSEMVHPFRSSDNPEHKGGGANIGYVCPRMGMACGLPVASAPVAGVSVLTHHRPSGACDRWRAMPPLPLSLPSWGYRLWTASLKLQQNGVCGPPLKHSRPLPRGPQEAHPVSLQGSHMPTQTEQALSSPEASCCKLCGRRRAPLCVGSEAAAVTPRLSVVLAHGGVQALWKKKSTTMCRKRGCCCDSPSLCGAGSWWGAGSVEEEEHHYV